MGVKVGGNHWVGVGGRACGVVVPGPTTYGVSLGRGVAWRVAVAVAVERAPGRRLSAMNPRQ